jgi:hypothetical protein
VPYRYQGRDAQATAIARARHWVGRLEQLAHFETVVLSPREGDEPGRPASASTVRSRPVPRVHEQPTS